MPRGYKRKQKKKKKTKKNKPGATDDECWENILFNFLNYIKIDLACCMRLLGFIFIFLFELIFSFFINFSAWQPVGFRSLFDGRQSYSLNCQFKSWKDNLASLRLETSLLKIGNMNLM